MAYEIWQRVQSKWRGLLVYILLEAATRFVTTFIQGRADTAGLRLFAAVVGVATAVFCLVQEWQLLTSDRDGDEAWPPIWS